MAGLEEQTRQTLSEQTGYECVKNDEVGLSGNLWEIDCVLIGPGGVRIAYVEVKDTWTDANQSTYINHMRRAYARMGDFRHKSIPKAVVVGDRREFGHKDWTALFESINCSLLAYNELEQLIGRID